MAKALTDNAVETEEAWYISASAGMRFRSSIATTRNVCPGRQQQGRERQRYRHHRLRPMVERAIQAAEILKGKV